jgi:hypothetical protein
MSDVGGTQAEPAADEGNELLPPLPDRYTEACDRYTVDVTDLVAFVGFVAGLATRFDDVQRIAIQALRNTARSDEERERYEAELETGGATVQQLRELRHLFLQMMFSRAVDNFLTYVSELLALVFRTRRETLRSSEMVRLDEVLRHDSMDELVISLADRRVNRLAYLGMRELVDDLDRAIEVIEIRNLIAHNRAVVNRTFLGRLPGYVAEEGELVSLDIDRLLSELSFLTKAAYDIDGRAVAKFVLPTVTPSDRAADPAGTAAGPASAGRGADTAPAPNQ